MSNRYIMGRRQFLRVSTASAVATAVLGPKLFAAERAGAPRRLAVGYASFDEPRLASAAYISSADGGFIGRGARVTVNRASGLARSPLERRGVELRAHFSYFDGAERKSTPFTAWGSSRASGAQGSGAAFTYPVDEVQKISFTLHAESGAPAGAATRRDAMAGDATVATELPLVLSLQNEAGSLKLARGFYVVVPLFENDAEPNWSAFTMGEYEGRRALLDADGKVAPFEHLVLAIDYAAQS